MIPDADKKLNELLKDPEKKKEHDKYKKLEKDPRITKVGRILRKTSLDESIYKYFNWKYECYRAKAIFT